MTPTLVTVFAHPDDETFTVGGSMAAAADAGARVVTICATRGEVGEIADPSLATRETLGAVREAELRAACAVLGVHDVRFLDYRDSGMEGTPENADPRAFANATDAEVVRRIAGHLRELRPDVVVTFEPGGVYGHPDHTKISRCATAAFDEVGGSRLFYSGPSRSRFAAFIADLKAAGIEGFPFEDAAAFGVDDEHITTVVEVGTQLERKKRALAQHRTQINPWLASLKGEWLDRILAQETFGLVRGARTAGTERSLLEGLPVRAA